MIENVRKNTPRGLWNVITLLGHNKYDFHNILDYEEDFNALTEEIYMPGEYGAGLDQWNNSEIIWTSTNSSHAKDFWDNMGTIPVWNLAGNSIPGGMATPRPGIQCTPTPGPFMPCNDLFDWWTLRCSVWIVFLLALLGNFLLKCMKF